MKNNMRLNSSSNRVIAAMLMFFVLGLVFVNARSTSHGQFEHHHVDGGHHISEDGKQYGDAAITASPGFHTDHSEDQHDPGDHTHDIPLRFILAVAALTVLQSWHPDRPIPFRNSLLFLFERPPKPLRTR
jgi:hypothetical protein